MHTCLAGNEVSVVASPLVFAAILDIRTSGLLFIKRHLASRVYKGLLGTIYIDIVFNA